MTTLFDSARPVNPPRPFGRGLATRPERRMPYTAADLAWAAATSPFADEDFDVLSPTDPVWDALAAEDAAADALERGFIPLDLAGYIAATSPGGHPA